MADLWVTCPEVIDPAALDQDLREALGGEYDGLSTGAQDDEGRWLRLHFRAEPAPRQIAQAEAIIGAHDPARVERALPSRAPTVEELLHRIEQLEAAMLAAQKGTGDAI